MFASPIMLLLLSCLSTTLVLSGGLAASKDPKLEQSALNELVTTMQSEIGLIKSELKATKSELKETKAQLNETKTELNGAKKELTVTKSALTESRNVLAQSLIKVRILIHLSCRHRIFLKNFYRLMLMLIECITF